MVEHLWRLGDASVHRVGAANEDYAQVYHYHNTLEVIVVRRGWFEGLVAGVVGVMKSGMIVVIGSDVPHCVLRASADCKVMLVHIPLELLRWDEERFPELTHGIEYIRGSKSGMVYNDARLADRIAMLAGKIASADGFMRMSLFMRLLHVLSTTPPSNTVVAGQLHAVAKKEKARAIDRAYGYIYEHFKDDFSLSEIADYSGLNPSALCRAFKKLSGSTIWQFCTRLRIEYACNLLLTTNMDVAEIAYQSGYNSYSHFCTQFKSVTRLNRGSVQQPRRCGTAQCQGG